MDAAKGLTRDDDTPPPSGVRPRVFDLHDPEARPQEVSPAAKGATGEAFVSPDVLVEVGEEVFFEVWSLLRAFSPLQGAWLKLGLGQIAGAALTTGLWSTAGSTHPSPRKKMLRERWPELVPGFAGMDRLAEVMVERLC